jgi:O-antigen/teichoic acid export membrane protein
MTTVADPTRGTELGAVTGTGGVARLLRGFAVMAVGTLGARLIGFVVLALVARKAGPDSLGAYSFALGLAAYFVALPSNFGIGTLAIRDIARDPRGARRVVGEALALEALLGALCLLVFLALIPVLARDSQVAALMPLVGVYYVAYNLTADWALQALQRMTAVTLVRLGGQVVFGAVTPLILVGGFEGVRRFALMMVAGAAISAVLALLVVWRAVGAPRLPRSLSALRRRVTRSAPFGFSLVMVQVYYSIDQILLGYLRENEDVGQYAAAAKLPIVLMGFTALWATALYPHATRVFEQDREALRRQLGGFSSLAIVAALPLAVGSTLVGRDVMLGLFGAAFGPAATPFAVLMWATAIAFVSINATHVLLAIGGERDFAVAVTAGAVLNVALNFALIPGLGPTGAALATLAAEAMVLVVSWRRLATVLGPAPLDARRILGALAANGAMALALISVPEATPPAIRIALGAVVCAAGAIAFRAVRRSDVALLRRG